LIEGGQLPIVVGGTGLWLRAALSDLSLIPPVEDALRQEVEREMEERGSDALHEELPDRFANRVHPNDRNRIARWTALIRSGMQPETDSSGMWQADLRHPTRMVGLIDTRDEIARRIDQRVEEMHREASTEARSLASSGASRTARAAIGVDGFVSGELDEVKAQHRAYAKRQITWMKKMPGVELVERDGATDAELAQRILGQR
jgi:tRNA dimethylallyltransferase